MFVIAEPALPIPIPARDNLRMTTASHDPPAPRSLPRYCRGCNYDLRATTSENPRCPECGRPFDPANPRTTRRRPVRRWLRHVRRAVAGVLILFLLLAGVWGWFFWGWYSERQALISLKLDPDGPDVRYTPILTPWPTEHLGRAGFVLDRVTTLHLLGRSDITDLAPLVRFTDLQQLNLDDTGVSDLAPLAGLTNLRLLRLEGTGVTDLAPLARLTNLNMLHFDGTHVTDLAPLARCTNLQALTLSGTRVTDLAPLGGLKSLLQLEVPQETISEAQVEALPRDLPDCAIDRR